MANSIFYHPDDYFKDLAYPLAKEDAAALDDWSNSAWKAFEDKMYDIGMEELQKFWEAKKSN